MPAVDTNNRFSKLEGFFHGRLSYPAAVRYLLSNGNFTRDSRKTAYFAADMDKKHAEMQYYANYEKVAQMVAQIHWT